MADSQSTSNLTYAQVPPQSGDFGALLQQLLGSVPNSFPSFQSALTQGVSSPIFQSILGPALSNLLPGEEMARSALMDEFRSGGALGSGAMGVASSRLESGLQGQRGNLISQVLANFLPQLVAGYGLQGQQAMDIPKLLAQVLGIVKPTVVSGQNAQSTGTNPNYGGMSGSGGSGGSLTGFIGQPGYTGPAFGQVPYGPGSPFGPAPGTSSSTSGYSSPTPYYNPFLAPGGGDLLSQYSLGGGLSGGGGGGYYQDPFSGFYMSDPGNTSQQPEISAPVYGPWE